MKAKYIAINKKIRYNINKCILQLELSTISSSVNWTSWAAHTRTYLVLFLKAKYIAINKKRYNIICLDSLEVFIL
jgi:archaellum biogenesis ATPase FlaH